MGQIVVVVQSGETTQAAVKEAVSTIEACSLKMMVLNKAIQSASDRYGYGYAYGYGYGYGYGNEK
jgi:protein-tyrosine kinase